MRMQLMTLPMLCLQLVACAPQTQVIWSNPKPERHNFDKERYACLKEASNLAPSEAANGIDMFGDPYSYDLTANNRETLFTACMNTKGWRLTQVAAVSSGKR